MKLVKVVLSLGVLLLAACGGGGDSTTSGTPSASASKYTVLVYMVGSDLESGGGAGTTDIAEMMQASSISNLKIIVETGGANKDGWRTVKRQLISQGSKTELSDLGDLNMGELDTLQDFVTWGAANYPADKYALIMWDHGGGAIGAAVTGATFGHDENHSSDALSLPEIKQALQNAYNVTGQKFDLLGFDACLMATLETAHTVSPFANYLVASEELEPGHGWDYKAILSAVSANTAIGGSALGQIIADSYKAHAQSQGPDAAPTITLSVTDLSKVPAVITALEGLATSAGTNLQSAGQTAWVTLATGRSKSEDYGSDEKNGSFTDMADIKHVASNLAAAYPAESSALITALNQAVVYKINGTARPNANGLTIFLPHKNINKPDLAGLLQAYDNIDFSQTYKDFLAQYTGIGDQDNSAPAFASESFSGTVYSAQVQGADVDAVYAVITQSDPATGTVLILGMDSADVDASGNVSYDWTGEWVTMNGEFISLNLEDEGSDVSTYSIPALLNGEEADILVMVDNNTGDYSILGAWPGIQNGAAAKEIIAINAGDVITPLFLSYDTFNDTEQWVAGTGFTVDAGGVDLALTPLPSGSYNLGLIAEDYAQNEQESQFVAIAVP